MNEPLSDMPVPGQPVLSNQGVSQSPVDPATLDLRDIHLPEPISWWPVAPGWWLVLFGLILIVIFLFVARRTYVKKQINRDIKAELDHIKDQFKKTQNKPHLAKELSILLRRASISYYPKTDIAGLTGEKWLSYLDDTHNAASRKYSTSDKKFQSDTGKILLTAPYLPADTALDFDATSLIQLCESWLLAKHNKTMSSTYPITSQTGVRKS